MPNQNNISIQGNENPPHMGHFLAQKLQVMHIPKSVLSQRMGLAPSAVTHYCKNSTIQSAILWKAGMALKHNLLADLATQFPYAPAADNPLQKRIEELERELAFYKNLVERKLSL